MLRYILALVTLLATPAITHAQVEQRQSARTIDVIYLQNGKRLQGHIISYVPGEELKFRSLGGTEITIPDFQLRKITQKRLRPVKVKGLYNVPEEGFYHTWQMAFIFNTPPSFEGALLGSEVSVAGGYRLNRLTGLGLGVGWDNYHPRAGERVMPIFLEGRRYLRDAAVAPFLQVRAGYGFAMTNREMSIMDAEGGWMVNPMIGYRLSGRKKVNLALGLGMKWQRASFLYENSRSSSEIELTYKRMQMSLALQF